MLLEWITGVGEMYAPMSCSAQETHARLKSLFSLWSSMTVVNSQLY